MIRPIETSNDFMGNRTGDLLAGDITLYLYIIELKYSHYKQEMLLIFSLVL
jgi:hypothetical protein